MTEKLQARIREMLALHKSYVDPEGLLVCSHCFDPWPCDAARALDALKIAVQGLKHCQAVDVADATGDLALAAVEEALSK